MLEWQPLTWHIFHTIALNYNSEYKEQYITFFNSIKNIIPCKECKEHFTRNISNKPEMYIENNINEDRFFNWTIDLHNLVNKKIQKTQWSYEQSKEYYIRNNFNNQTYKLFILEFVKHNFRKSPEKTQQLINMLNTLAYFHPNIEKRNKLIDFTTKFDLSKKSLRQWLISFLIILQNNPK
jgi:hypothetical protein